MIETKIEIYVVTTELAKAGFQALEEQKVKLCQIFGGLTVIPNCKGYWQNNGKLEHDVIDIWIIYTPTHNNANETLLSYLQQQIQRYAEKIQQICSQEVQLFVINDKPYFISANPCLTCKKKGKNVCDYCEHTEGEN